ncbi:GPI inositol-deacylase [Trichonephila clavipes]|nr:GPI inositol-deacylase [Trichonephila clavipes]
MITPIQRLLLAHLVAAVAEWYWYRNVACFVTGSSPVPLKTRRVGQRCTLNLSRAETSSRWKDRFTGNPVLFIPGNAGSHRQVRSLASVALRMAHSLHTTMFNFFAIDFNEGGVVSKAVFSLPSFDPADISLILTLAAPHKQPVVTLDFALVNFYAKIKETWKYRLKKGLMDIPIISIGGGHRDILVRSDLTSNHFQHKSSNDIEVLTASIPGVWVSTDHLAIVWRAPTLGTKLEKAPSEDEMAPSKPDNSDK